MSLALRFPAGPPVAVGDLLAGMASSDGPLAVGDPRVRDFLAALSGKLLSPSVARAHPELGSLGFFLRRAELARVVDRLATGDKDLIRRPRGLIFHVPPANVDTIFVYSWALSALCGNRNVVRISNRAAGAADAVLAALEQTVEAADPVIAQTQRMVSYDRDDAVTAELSAACDLRVIWGGDRSVTEIRRHPLAPLARDVVFPDRASFAVLGADGWRGADPVKRRAAVDGFANDVYWFDQAACSSPRALFVVGTPADAEKVIEEFRLELAEVVRERAWTVDAAMAVEKHVRLYGLAADGRATGVRFAGNALAWLDLADPAQPPREWLGAGVLSVSQVDDLLQLAPLIEARDQTLSHFGFRPAELRTLVGALAGRGIDRVVPFGQALNFAAVWDGYDLPAEFTRLTTLRH